jgi:hypothetical protein
MRAGVLPVRELAREDMTMSNETKELDPRSQQIADRKKRMAELTPKIPRVRVTPANDDLRRVLRHPNGMKFPPNGSVEWPMDQFTRRRIKDGSVTVEERAKDEHKDDKPRAPASPPARPPAP